MSATLREKMHLVLLLKYEDMFLLCLNKILKFLDDKIDFETKNENEIALYCCFTAFRQIKYRLEIKIKFRRKLTFKK